MTAVLATLAHCKQWTALVGLKASLCPGHPRHDGPLLAVGVCICFVDYSVVWRYFSWSNQALTMIALWAASVYLAQEKKGQPFLR